MSPEAAQDRPSLTSRRRFAGPRDVDGLVCTVLVCWHRRRRRSRSDGYGAGRCLVVLLALPPWSLARWRQAAGSEDRADRCPAYPQRIGSGSSRPRTVGWPGGRAAAGWFGLVLSPAIRESCSLPRNEIDSIPPSPTRRAGGWSTGPVSERPLVVVLDLVARASPPAARRRPPDAGVGVPGQAGRCWCPDQRARRLWSLVSVDGAVHPAAARPACPAGSATSRALVVTRVDAPADPRCRRGLLQYPRLWAVDVRDAARTRPPVRQVRRPGRSEFWPVRRGSRRTAPVSSPGSPRALYGARSRSSTYLVGNWPGTPGHPTSASSWCRRRRRPCAAMPGGDRGDPGDHRPHVGGGPYVSALTSAYGDQTVVAIDPSFRRPCLGWRLGARRWPEADPVRSADRLGDLVVGELLAGGLVLPRSGGWRAGDSGGRGWLSRTARPVAAALALRGL